MKRFCVQIAFNGTAFFGWQRQPAQISVQECIEENLSKLFGFQKITIVGCGRTDAGVHAHDFYLHVDLPANVEAQFILFKLNRMLPHSIIVHQVFEVAGDWHARFDASVRTYRYFLHSKKNPFINEFSWHYPQAFELNKMNEAAQFLLGKQDFTSLSKLHTDVKTNICEVYEAKWVIEADHRYYFEISANRFLRNMVRATVGTLLDVGTGKIEPEEIAKILAQKDRGAASISVPAQGLFLWKIEYPTF